MAKKSAAFDRESIRVCTDVYAPSDELERFAELAIAEDRSNVITGLTQAICAGSVLPQRIAVITAKKWQNGRSLKVAFLSGTSDQQEFVARVAGRWSEYANLAFEWGTSAASSDLRIDFRRSDGAWSYLGTDNLGISKSRPTMNLGWLDEAVVLHEFGHALGAIHEHQHPQSAIPWNKPAAYAFYGGPPNNWDRRTIDHNVIEVYSTGSTQFSQYDPRSIMHYAIDARLLLDPSRAVGWNESLSASDTKFISELYPKAPTPPPPPPIEPGKIAHVVLLDNEGRELARFRP